MDQLDTQIIRILQKDGRASNAGIARAVGVSEGTVRRRLKRLVQEEFIQVVALLDEVEWVAMTTGSYDIFTWVTLASAEALGIFLRTKVGAIPGVRRTETFVSLANIKRGYGVVI